MNNDDFTAKPLPFTTTTIFDRDGIPFIMSTRDDEQFTLLSGRHWRVINEPGKKTRIYGLGEEKLFN